MSQPPVGEPVPQHRRPSPHPAPARPADDGWGGGWASLSAVPDDDPPPPTDRIPVQAPVSRTAPEPPGSRSPDEDSSGRPLGMRLPSWDLLPPTELVQRHRGR